MSTCTDCRGIGNVRDALTDDLHKALEFVTGSHCQVGVVSDLHDRLVRAENSLLEMAQEASPDSDRNKHLTGKAEGVRLALSYLREEMRRAEPLPFVAIANGEEPPWAHLDNTCPKGCTTDVLPLVDSDPPGLSSIKCPVCEGVWLRGPITLGEPEPKVHGGLQQPWGTP